MQVALVPLQNDAAMFLISREIEKLLVKLGIDNSEVPGMPVTPAQLMAVTAIETVVFFQHAVLMDVDPSDPRYETSIAGEFLDPQDPSA